MKRFFKFALAMTGVMAVGVGTLSAGSVTYTQIGDGTNGLTYAYLTGTAPTIGVPDGTGVGTNSTYAFYGKSYDGRLFQNASPNPVPYTGYTPRNAQTGSITDTAQNSNVIFQMINDGCDDATAAGGSVPQPVRTNCGGGTGVGNGGTDTSNANQGNNVWMATTTGTLTVPIGVYHATDVYTVLDNLWGVAGQNDTDVTFNFGTSANGAIAKSLTLDLINAGDTTAASGQLGTALECSMICTGATAGFPSIDYATGPLAPTSVLAGVGGDTDTVTINTATVYSNAYNSATGTFQTTSGNAVLSAQDFLIPFYGADPYLVSIGFTELNGQQGVSATTLSAITVESAPEPSDRKSVV